MLKIFIHVTTAKSATLRFEGHPAGTSIAALRDTCEQEPATAGRTLALDPAEGSHIERPGFNLPASLSRRAFSMVRFWPFQGERLRSPSATSQNTTSSTP